MLLQTTLFLTTWTTLHALVTLHGPFHSISPFMKYNSRFYSFLSLLLFFLIVTNSPIAGEAYHLSKIYEYLDIFLVVLSGGKVGLHFGVHHTTTVWLTYVRVLPVGENEGWRWFGAANAAHHVGMYAYFGGWDGDTMRRVLVVTGQAQLVLGMVVDAVVGWKRWERGEEVWRVGVGGGLLGVYLGLSLRELWERRAERGGKGEVDKGE
ncbi:hypothetical protein QBC34DRAFT_295749 [Podospora aff. communis PSN243]|uniref:Fatty acid hydroxylase domain-containing protein n=1 Tax=Podospora aff. communis PSN243 TaxID=3040156 RepID=A0AAV9GS60_9PEZI|nr:hypothetical protein QBC34DRAFT_295749 [Podospora aff. communis PSN243]